MKTILLVEDDINLCDILSKMLKFEGINTIVVGNGHAAMEVLEKLPDGEIGAILCDVMMPDMDGYAFLDCVNGIEKFSSIPFIFISACVSKDEETKGLAMGAKAFLKKPVDISTILSTLKYFGVD
jgi:CheY-like chemotaxis protein